LLDKTILFRCIFSLKYDTIATPFLLHCYESTI
jgi:hypothetical protein